MVWCLNGSNMLNWKDWNQQSGGCGSSTLMNMESHMEGKFSRPRTSIRCPHTFEYSGFWPLMLSCNCLNHKSLDLQIRKRHADVSWLIVFSAVRIFHFHKWTFFIFSGYMECVYICASIFLCLGFRSIVITCCIRKHPGFWNLEYSDRNQDTEASERLNPVSETWDCEKWWPAERPGCSYDHVYSDRNNQVW